MFCHYIENKFASEACEMEALDLDRDCLMICTCPAFGLAFLHANGMPALEWRDHCGED